MTVISLEVFMRHLPKALETEDLRDKKHYQLFRVFENSVHVHAALFCGYSVMNPDNTLLFSKTDHPLSGVRVELEKELVTPRAALMLYGMNPIVEEEFLGALEGTWFAVREI